MHFYLFQNHKSLLKDTSILIRTIKIIIDVNLFILNSTIYILILTSENPNSKIKSKNSRIIRQTLHLLQLNYQQGSNTNLQKLILIFDSFSKLFSFVIFIVSNMKHSNQIIQSNKTKVSSQPTSKILIYLFLRSQPNYCGSWP